VSDHQAEELSVSYISFSARLRPAGPHACLGSGLTFSFLGRLAAVNFFLGIVGIVQVSRIVAYNQSKKKNPVQGAIEEVKQAAQS
jgi:hypothetical protein